MTRRMSETAVTSKDIVLQLDRDHSKIYDTVLQDKYDTHLRLDIPFDLSSRVGTRFADKLNVYVNNLSLLVSVLPLSLKTERKIEVGSYFQFHGGNPRSENLTHSYDDNWFIIPEEFAPFLTAGDQIVWTLHLENQGEERYLEIHKY